jgi:pimeloyl-ACP methyl ester carboxylesterase
MENLRKYGKAPCNVALIHGGPGAPGEMAPVARELAFEWGVLEPLQTAHTLEGQVEELRAVLEMNTAVPVMLIGYSWGAWLGIVIAARYPSLVRKLILISSGPFEVKYAQDIMKTRLDRLGNGEREEVLSLIESFNDAKNGDLDKKMSRFGQLISKSDSYDPISHNSEVLETQYEIYQNVWKEAEELRSRGELLALAGQIQCHVTAIHGDHDPHPAKGVEEPLSRTLRDFKFILLDKCGHTPWIERNARHDFFRILRRELKT